MEKDILIEARGLTRRYGPNVAVHGIDLTLKRGEILGLRGPNGAGKCTTMKMLTGNLATTGGTVKINGVDLIAEPKKAKQSLGYLPELPPVHPEVTVDEYLGFAAALHGIPAAQRKAADLKAIPLGKLRHSNISRMRAAGVAADVVAAWHGHTERMTMAVYGRVTDDRLTSAADVFTQAR